MTLPTRTVAARRPPPCSRSTCCASRRAAPSLHVRLNRPAKRNAVSDALVAQLHTAFVNLPEATRAVVLSGEGDHFCAGLDLVRAVGAQRRRGHRPFALVARRVRADPVRPRAGGRGAARRGRRRRPRARGVGHIRVAEASAFYGLPEGQRGLFVGGGGSARIPRLIGAARMTDMMLTGRVYDAAGGPRRSASRSTSSTAAQGLAKAFALAERIAANAPLSNFAVMHALPRIADMAQAEGLFVESLMAAIASGDEAAKTRIRAFLEGTRGEGQEGVTQRPAARYRYRAAARRLARGRLRRSAPTARRWSSRREPLGAVPRAPHRPPRRTGPARDPSAPWSPSASRAGRRLAPRQLRRGAGARARDRARRCSTAASRPSGRSRSCPTTTSSTCCSPSARCSPACRSRRSRRRIRSSRRTTASCATSSAC